MNALFQVSLEFSPCLQLEVEENLDVLMVFLVPEGESIPSAVESQLA